MRRFKRRVLLGGLSVLLLSNCVSPVLAGQSQEETDVQPQAILAESYAAENNSGVCTSYVGTNAGHQFYRGYSEWWEAPNASFITRLGTNSIMTVQGDVLSGKLVAAYYDDNFNLTSVKEVELSLPIFGGYYYSGGYYYVVTGQNNPDCDDNAEVIRITKYNSSWREVAHDSICGFDTAIPFDAANLRFTEYGDYVFIRSGHEMYNGHQANITIAFKKSTMKITDSFGRLSNLGNGYVSHSFNQFLGVDGTTLVTVDHGDANPRGVVLCKYSQSVTGGTFTSPVTSKMLLDVATAEKENCTGTEIGGFEITSSKYLVAGCSTAKNNTVNDTDTKNVFLSVTSKNLNSSQITWITDYSADSQKKISPPSLVKIGTDDYLLIWTENATVKYTEISGDGTLSGEIHSMVGDLSDCQPVVINNKVTWYVWNGNDVTFYQIPVSDLGNAEKKTVSNGHDYVKVNLTGGVTTLQCSKCGDEITKKVPTSYTMYWNEDPSSLSFASGVTKQKSIGDKVKMWIYSVYPSDADIDYTITVSNPAVATVSKLTGYTADDLYEISFVKAGTVTINVTSVYDASVKRSYTFTVSDPNHPSHTYVQKDATWSKDRKSCTFTVECSGSDCEFSENVKVTDIRKEVSEGTCTSEGSVVYTAQTDYNGITLSSTITDATPVTEHKFTVKDTTASGARKSYATCEKPAEYYYSCAGCGVVDTEGTAGTFYDGEAFGHDLYKDKCTWIEDDICEMTIKCHRCSYSNTQTYQAAEAPKYNTVANCVTPESKLYLVRVECEGKKFSEINRIEGDVDPDKHNFVVESSTEPTCEEDGVTRYICTNEFGNFPYPELDEPVLLPQIITPCCVIREERVPALGHDYRASYSWDDDSVTDYSTCELTLICGNDSSHVVRETMNVTQDTVASTCITEGYVEYTATLTYDDKQYQSVKKVSLPLAEHTEELDVTYDPTCTDDGFIGGKHCSVCGKVLEETEIIPATGHDYQESYSWDDDSVTDYTTCELILTCAKNPEHVVRKDMNVTQDTVASTCITEGYVEYTATLTYDGKQYQSVKKVSLPLAAHTEVIDEGTKETCTEDGMTAGKHCSVCGEILEEQKIIPATGHNYVTEYKWIQDEETGNYCYAQVKTCQNDQDYVVDQIVKKLTAVKINGYDRPLYNLGSDDNADSLYLLKSNISYTLTYSDGNEEERALGDDLKPIVSSSIQRNGDKGYIVSVTSGNIEEKLEIPFAATTAAPVLTVKDNKSHIELTDAGQYVYKFKAPVTGYYNLDIGTPDGSSQCHFNFYKSTELSTQPNVDMNQRLVNAGEVYYVYIYAASKPLDINLVCRPQIKVATTRADGLKVVSKKVGTGNNVEYKLVEEKIPRIASVTLAATSYTYNTKAKKPAVTVKDSAGNIIPAANYTVTYANNINVGTATAKIVFKGSYAGTVNRTFVIKKFSAPAAVRVTKIVNTVNGPTVTWSLTANAGSYEIYRSVNGGGYAKAGTVAAKLTTKQKTASYVDVKAKTNGNKYTYKVIAVRTLGNVTVKSAASAGYSSYYMAAPPTVKVASKVSRTIKVVYSANSKATGYQIRYSLNANMAGAKVVNMNGYKNISKNITVLTKGKRYYVSVRSCKTVDRTTYYSPWTTPKGVTSK